MAYAEKLPSGQWRGVYRDLDGKRQYKAIGIGKNSWPTKKLALKWAQDQESDVRRGQWQDPRHGEVRYADWVEVWWQGHHVEPTTRDTDRNRIDRYLLERWGDTAISDITPSAVRAWVSSLSKPVDKGGMGLSPWTTRRIYYLFRGSIELAVVDRKIRDNPAIGVQLPTPPPGRKVFYTQSQVEQIRAQMNNDVDRLITLFLPWTGLRWGEFAGLHVDCVDLMREQIEVRHTLVETTGRRYIKSYPKGKVSRIVPIAPALLGPLMDWAMNVPVAKSCGFIHQQGEKCPGALLFGIPPRGFVTRNSWGRGHWHPARRKASEVMERAACRDCDDEGLDADGAKCSHGQVMTQLPYGRPHDLRHTFASWMLQNGLSLEYLQRLMGHESIRTTQQYAHWQPNQFDRAREVMAIAWDRDRGAKYGADTEVSQSTAVQLQS